MVSVAEPSGHYNFGTEIWIHDKTATVVVPISWHWRLAAIRDFTYHSLFVILDTMGQTYPSQDLQVTHEAL